MLKRALFTPNALRIDGSATTALLAASVRPGMEIIARPGSTIRATMPSCTGLTIYAYGATILGSTALAVGGATVISGTKYKIATSLHPPYTGGTTNSIYLYTNGVGYDGTDPTPIPRISTNAAADVTASTWAMPGDGFLYFDLGRSVTGSDVFEMPQRNCASVEASGMRILGGTWWHSEGYTFACGLANPYNGLEIGYVDAAWGSSDCINVNGAGGACRENHFRDSTFHDTQYDGGGGGDGISFENVSVGSVLSTGLIERCTFRNCGKSGIGNNDAIIDYHDILLDASSVALGSGGPAAGVHTWTRIRMINQWASPATGIHGIYILPTVSASAIVSFNGLSIYRGTGSLTTLRAFRAQGGDVRLHNCVVDSHGAANAFAIGIMSSAATWTESNNASGGNGTNFSGFTQDASDIDLAATPFTSAATGDLTPNALIAGKGVGGVDIGYTASPA